MRRFLLLLLLPLTLHGAPPGHEPRMSWLDNGTIRLGVDLNLGGAITWLSRSGVSQNVINSRDWGREVQMSFYGGPVPYLAGEKRPAKEWETLGWNPVQAGDYFGHPSRVLEEKNDGKKLYVKCAPMQWPLDNVSGDCTFESWLELAGANVIARCRLQNARTDHTSYGARSQELPAVYTNGTFYRLVTYTADRPFDDEPLTEPEAKPPPAWNHWRATEHWAALVNERGWGLGVYNPTSVTFIGGFAGEPGAGGASDDPCGYLAPTRLEILDHNITYDFEYALVLGTVPEIRAQALRWQKSAPPLRPIWNFAEDRQGWTYRNATDAGWPIKGALQVRWKGDDPGLVSPIFFARAGEASVLHLTAAFRTPATTGELFWATVSHPGFAAERTLRFPITGDGAEREYRVKLPVGAGEALTQIRLDPADDGEGELRVREIRLEAD